MSIKLSGDVGIHRSGSRRCFACAPGFPVAHGSRFCVLDCEGFVHAEMEPLTLMEADVQIAYRLERCDSCSYEERVEVRTSITSSGRALMELTDVEALICEALISNPSSPDELALALPGVTEPLALANLESLHLRGVVFRGRSTDTLRCPACLLIREETDYEEEPARCQGCTLGEPLEPVYLWMFTGRVSEFFELRIAA